MFLNSVILVLQEILEAALLISVLLAFAHLFRRSWEKPFELHTRWVAFSLVFGFVGAAVNSYYMPEISALFDYVGQEVFNASIHLLSLLLVLSMVFLVPNTRVAHNAVERSRIAAISMIGIVGFSIVREGSEIMLYIGGVAGQAENFTPVMLGSFIGTGIGLSIGVLLFYGLVTLPVIWSFRVSLILLCLIAGNMGAQAVLLFTQADWLPYTAIAWNSSSALPENSIVGYLLYVLIGYEATPSILQVAIYLLGVVLVIVSPLFRKTWHQKEVLADVQ